MNKKIASEIAIGIILLLAIMIGGIFYWQNKNSGQQPEQRACTEEAKLCDDGSYVSRTGPNCEFTPCSETKSLQLANPASTYCVENGGKSEIRTNPDGSQIGYCKLNNGSECEEWAYFRKECGNEAADWQTYKNEKYGFEFKYPNYWSLEENEVFKSNANYKLSVRYISKEQNSLSAPTFCMVNSQDARCQIVKIYENYYANIDWKLGNKNNSFIDIQSPDGGRVEFQMNNFIDTDKTIFLKILSTFKFIDTAENETADWQTYKSEKYGYELKYPQGYVVQKSDTPLSCNLNLNNERGQNDISIHISDYDNYEKHKEYIDKGIILDFDVFINDLNDRCIENAYSWIGGPEAQTPKLIKSENLKINGMQVLKRTYAHLDPAGVPLDRYFSTWRFKENSSYYTLMYNNGKEMKTNIPNDIFIKFLENFKFTK